MGGSAIRAGALGLLAAAALGAAVALALLLVYALAWLLSMAGGAERLGPAEYTKDGRYVGAGAALLESLRGVAAVLKSIWMGLAGLTLTGGVAGLVYFQVGRAKRDWGPAGAFIAVFGVGVVALMQWAYGLRLSSASALSDRDQWETADTFTSFLHNDFALIASAAGVALLGSVAVFQLWAWFFELLAVSVGPGRSPSSATQGLGSAERPAEEYVSHPERMRKLRREIDELRRADTRTKTAYDPVLDGTAVVDRQRGRSVPIWMEPVAGLNATLGRPLLSVFVVSLAMWFGGDVLRGGQHWEFQREEVTLGDPETAMAAGLRVGAESTALRVFGLRGTGIVEVSLAGPGNRQQSVLDRFVALNRPPSSDRRLDGAPLLSLEVGGLAPGQYRLVLYPRAGGEMLLGYSLGHRVPTAWRLTGSLLALGASGLVVAGFGLLGVGYANARAYFRP